MVKALSCPSCGGAVSVKYSETSLSCVCPNCLAVLSMENESVKILTKHQKQLSKPLIALGGRHKFRGHDWEVIGYMLRSDRSEVYKWSEYLLFNPYVGYRFLVCMDGHWSYVVKTKSAPKVNTATRTATYLNKNYKLFHKGEVRTLFVLGEFYWRVHAGEAVTATDYIRPPEMLSLEKDADEEIWSLGEYVPKGDVEKAFKLNGIMPWDMGVAPHQPSPHSESKKISNYLAYLLMFLLCAQAVFILGVKRTEIFSEAYDVTLPQGYKLQTPSFTIDDKMGYVESELRATVSNDWFEADVEVVNEDAEDSEESYQYDQGVEYYHGSDYDGSWSEGSQESDRRIAKLPPGRYHLNITTNAGTNQLKRFSLKISQGNLSWGNFVFALLLVILYPVYYFYRSSNFEKERWLASDHSPYWDQSDNDD